MAFQYKVVIVTGGAQGIGRSCCLHFARQGALVFCGDRNEEAGSRLENEWALERKQSEQKNSLLSENLLETSPPKGSITFVPFDATNGSDCRKLVDMASASSSTGDIDVLFNNVGIQPKEGNVPIHLLEENVWDEVFSVNIKSFYWMCKYAIKVMLLHSTKMHSIINNASIQGIQSQKGVSAYAATKGAILSLTRQLAVEYGDHQIRVNSISPGSILTPLALANNKSLDYISQNTPLGVIGDPMDVAELVGFLADSKSKWITGQNFVVDGGITVKGGWAPLNDDSL